MTANKEGRSIEDVATQCLACEWKDSDRCDCCDNNPVSQCIPAFVPTDEELTLLAGATEEVLLNIRAKIKNSAVEWKGLDHPFPANDGMIIERKDMYFNMPSRGTAQKGVYQR